MLRLGTRITSTDFVIIDIPKVELALLRSLNPDSTDEELLTSLIHEKCFHGISQASIV